jgi:mRNA-degrading endonuclease YafQ of YafQ-DinJ toxin-antitoxin module
MVAWKVDYEPQVKAEIRSQLSDGTLTKDDLQALAKWVDEIESHGLDHVQTAYWNDHPLEAEWTGLRSASFSLRGRIICRAEDSRLIVMVVRVTATHNYRK